MSHTTSTLEPVESHEPESQRAPGPAFSAAAERARVSPAPLAGLRHGGGAGCGRRRFADESSETSAGADGDPAATSPRNRPQAVRVVRPQRRNMTFTVGQPGFVEAY